MKRILLILFSLSAFLFTANTYAREIAISVSYGQGKPDHLQGYRLSYA